MIDSAMGLFALRPPDDVTVADIAAAADMTPAAVYYHFPSKEHVLLEGLQLFTDRYLQAVRNLLRTDEGTAWPAQFITGVFEWVEEERTPATVYFAHSAGVNASIEALRRRTRIAQVVVLGRLIRSRLAVPRSNVEPEVAAIGMVALIESAARSWLIHDVVVVGLGGRRFIDETTALAQRIVGEATSAQP